MGSRIENRVVLGSLRYKSASDTNLLFQVPLVQTAKEIIEFDRNISIDLQQLYDDERQKSTLFRPISKISLLFENLYVGTSNYYPYQSALYYTNINELAKQKCTVDSTNILYSGYPQYYEFDFIRYDNEISGYTTPDSASTVHRNFVNKSATTYNWSINVSYPYENVYNKQMSAIDPDTKQVMTWVSSDGIPFIVKRDMDQNQTVISFTCPVPHGLSVGEYVKLNFDYLGTDTFQVYSLGTPFFGSEDFVFNIYDVGYTGTTFNSGVNGTFKRIVDINNSGETMSEYYVRKHKIITEVDECVITKTGFEQLIFNKVKEFFKSPITANNQKRVGLKDGNSVYNITFNEDIDINGIVDNQKRPLTKLYYTIIWKGYMGWTLGLKKPGGGFYGLKQGWDFNVPPLTANTISPNSWWNNSNQNSDTNFTIVSYTTSTGNPTNPFTYVKPLSKGDTLDGDYCEWNDSEQTERVISDIYHKFRFNPFYFNVGKTLTFTPFGDAGKGYYYKPLHPITIRTFSDYLEEGNPQNVVGIPEYAYFSNSSNTFIWKDLYPYGFVDSNGVGVDYPFLNGGHYPYENIFFRLFGEGSTYSYGQINNSVVAEPTIDNCE